MKRNFTLAVFGPIKRAISSLLKKEFWDLSKILKEFYNDLHKKLYYLTKKDSRSQEMNIFIKKTVSYLNNFCVIVM